MAVNSGIPLGRAKQWFLEYKKIARDEDLAYAKQRKPRKVGLSNERPKVFKQVQKFVTHKKGFHKLNGLSYYEGLLAHMHAPHNPAEHRQRFLNRSTGSNEFYDSDDNF